MQVRRTIRALLSDGFDYHALPAPTIEFRIVDLLPGSQVQSPLGNRYDDLVVYEQALEVRVTIHFPGVVMAVVRAKRRQFLKPFIDVFDESQLSIVHIHTRCDVHR